MDVVTVLNAPATVRADQPYVYSITVRNTGSTSVSGVVVRDFFYKQASTSNPEAVVFGNGSWSCAAGAGGNCGPSTSGSGVIFASGIVLQANGEVTYTATRPIVQTANGPDAGALFSVAAAAFTNPSSGEQILSNNSVSSTGTIVVTQPPAITGLPITTQVLLEDSIAGPFNFTVSDPDTNLNGVSVTATSNNQGLVSNAGAVIAGSLANRSLTVNPVANANGNVNIAVTANDGTGNTDVENVSFTIIAVNDAPSFAFTQNCVVKSGIWNPASFPPEFVFPAGTNDGETCVDFTSAVFGPSDEAGQGYATPATAAVEVLSNSNPALFAQLPRFTTVENLLQFRPNGSSGIADISIRIRDNGGTANGGVDVSAPATFRIRVQGAAPTISAVTNQTINEDGTTGVIAVTVADADTAPGSLILSATSSNSSLIPNANVVLGGSGSNRTVSITPMADQFGSSTITLTISDGAQQSQQTFTVNVISVNDAPTFDNLGDQLLPTASSSGLKTVSGWASAISVGPANESGQSVDSFFVEVLAQSQPNFLSGAPQVTNSGNLRFSLTNNGSGQAFDGYACLRVTLFDDGPGGGAPDVHESTPVVLKVQVGAGSFDCNTVSLARSSIKR
jgi:hypothetical protein